MEGWMGLFCIITNQNYQVCWQLWECCIKFLALVVFVFGSDAQTLRGQMWDLWNKDTSHITARLRLNLGHLSRRLDFTLNCGIKQKCQKNLESLLTKMVQVPHMMLSTREDLKHCWVLYKTIFQGRNVVNQYFWPLFATQSFVSLVFLTVPSSPVRSPTSTVAMWHLSQFWQLFIRKSYFSATHWIRDWMGRQVSCKFLERMKATKWSCIFWADKQRSRNAVSHMTAIQFVMLLVLQAWNLQMRLFICCCSCNALADTTNVGS